MIRKGFYIVSCVALLIALGIVFWMKPIRVESAVVTKGNFEETFTYEGRIRAKDKQTVYAFTEGNIDNLRVKLGDPVKAGETLTILEHSTASAVKSPLNGVVSKVFRDSAGPILRGAPIVEVSSLSNLEIVAELLTPDAVRLSKGGEAKILHWGGAGEIPAKVIQISRAGEIKTSALGVEEERTEVKLAFDQKRYDLSNKVGDTYHVDVLFYVSREASVLSIPLGALFKNGESWAVYRIVESRARLTPVTVTKKNDRLGLVASGLKEGDRVILFPGDKIHGGIRVR